VLRVDFSFLRLRFFGACLNLMCRTEKPGDRKMILREATVSYAGKRIEASRSVKHAADAVAIFREWGIADRVQECFGVMFLTTRHQCVGVQMVAMGTLSEVSVHPRELFRGAILAGAAAVLMVHNHPSGDPSPSADDLAITRRMKECGDLLGIPVLDHVIVTAGGGYVSLAEQGGV
jgi:DNA repair protein RadC